METIARNAALIEGPNPAAVVLAGCGLLVEGLGERIVGIMAFLLIVLGSASLIPVALVRRRPAGGGRIAILVTVTGLGVLIFRVVTS